MSGVGYRVEGRASVITFDHPPVNGLSHAVRTGLADALERALADVGSDAIVLAGGGRQFSAGADIREFGTPAATAEPTLRQVIDLVECAAKPVIAAIRGSCLGGGLELALAAHHRVAAADASLGLPEVKLGLIPGAGGTQRLPRLVGPARALELILSGEAVRAEALRESGLLDQVVAGDPIAGAVAFAGSREVAQPPRRTRDLRVQGPELAKAVAAARTRLADERHPLPALVKVVDAVEAAGLPFDEGLAVERAAFVELMASPESKALRHAFLAERAAAKVEGITDATPTRAIAEAVVIGAGTMGAGIAVTLLDAGIAVWLLEADQTALDRGRARIAGIYEAQVQKGRLTPAERDRRLARLRPILDYGAIASADLAIEAVVESLPLKLEVFAALDRVMKPGAILATNTSTLDVDAIAASTSRPADVLGLHFFSPANVMRLLEVVRAGATSPEVLATALALARTLRKVPVVAGVCDGFIGNRMLDAYVRQAWWLVEEGAMPWQVDRAIEAFGFAMGPFRVGDLVGHDVSQAIRDRRRADRADYRCSTLPDELGRLGRLGQKTGGGWYDYPGGPRRPVPAPEAEALVERHRVAIGVTSRAIDDWEIVDRLVFALVNEGARLLEEGIAARAADIDVVWFTGYGFPRWRGGPMYHAEQVGLHRVAARMREFAGTHGDADFWRPAPLLGVGAWSEGEEEPRRRRRGFTLLEVMVALVLTSLIALLAYGAARITGDTRTQLNQHLRSVHAARGARELLPDLLHNVRAPQRRGDTTMILRGDTLWLIAAGVVPFDPDYDWLVELHPGPGGLEVDGLARGLSPPARVRFRLPEVTRWEVALLPAKGSEWNRDWSPAAGSPRAVRVTLWNDTQPVGLPVVVRLPGARSADQADEEDETQNDR